MHQSTPTQLVDLRSILKKSQRSCRSKKLVGFDMYPPHVIVLPEHMDSFCNGQTCFQAREEDIDDGTALSEQYFAEAEALEKGDLVRASGVLTTDYFSLPLQVLTRLNPCRPPTTPCPESSAPARRSLTPVPKVLTPPGRPQAPGRQLEALQTSSQVAGLPTHVHRKPVAARAQTTLIPMPPTASRPKLHSSSTSSSRHFDDFLATENLAHDEEDTQARRANLHPFEDPTLKTLKCASSFCVEARAKDEKKLQEKMS
jgi:hypothetical protein